jgi:hypothetical protein
MPGKAFVADETYIKIRGVHSFVWFIMDAASRSILGYQVSDNRGVGPCIMAMRMAFEKLKNKLPEGFLFVADGYSAYPLAAQQLAVYLASPESCLLRYEKQGDVPVLSSLADSEEIKSDMVASALNDQSGLATNQPSIPKMGDYWDPMQALGEGIYNKDVTESNLQTQLDALVDSILSTLTD